MVVKGVIVPRNTGSRIRTGVSKMVNLITQEKEKKITGTRCSPIENSDSTDGVVVVVVTFVP